MVNNNNNIQINNNNLPLNNNSAVLPTIPVKKFNFIKQNS